ncbi:corticotropin-releasing factor receptor 2 isoform X4 [Rissa tridactyla]|uniref:corticotropin-releasing factor receptor 2 isoform X4 n=1 Tax=Rissa tridactyla TaxID=75485 RepID=UPI0023BA7DE7|nr:corticotropin-releasing factor receptor 2 isoform X4 [Rissa tridactyla]
MAGRAPQRSLPAAAAAALLLLPIVLHCESSVNLPLSVLLEKYCEALSARTNVTGPYCNATTDQIGTCWPRTSAGELVERPCPEFFNGIKYNTTRNAYRECLGNGTWASKINYSQCEPILDDKPWCRCITTVYNYFVVTNFFWMFVEGCYLHTAIVMTYSTDKLRKWVFLFIGWCIPCPIIIAWAIGKLYYENEQCWFGKEPGKYIDYIYQGPVILVLLINFVFLFNIVRILMTKLRASTTSETIQYRKAVKATLVLLPLLGITYMLFFVNPGEDDISQIVFIYFNSFLQSFQGFFVSVFYCFLNGEVRSAARKRWHRWQDHHSLRVRVARAMSIPTSPTRISFHSIKQTAAV